MRVFDRDISFSENLIGRLEGRLTALFADRSSTLNHRNAQQTLKTELDGIPLIVKRYIGANTGLAKFRPSLLSRAFRAYRLAARLRECSVTVPRPLLLAAYESDLITVSERVEAKELYLEMRKPSWPDTREDRTANEISKLMRTMADHRITHGDLHARNILVNGRGETWLIDLDGLRFHSTSFGFHKRRKKEEQRLGESLYLAAPDLCHKSGFRLDDTRWRWRDF